METSFENLQFYVKVVTGLLLLLNLALLISIRIGMGWARQATAHLSDEERPEQWNKASRALSLLILVVITMNGAAIYANYHLRQSAEAVLGENFSSVAMQSEISR